MSTPLVFIDTETDGLHPGRKAWEIALIRRDHLGQTETHFFVGIDIRDSNPDALSIGRFWDRHPSGRKMAGLKALPDSVNVLTQHDAAKEVMRWTFGAHRDRRDPVVRRGDLRPDAAIQRLPAVVASPALLHRVHRRWVVRSACWWVTGVR